MARRKQQSLLDVTFDLLKLTPFWFGPLVAVVTFVFIRYVVPLLLPRSASSPTGIVLRPFLPGLSWMFGAIVLITWVAAEIYKFSNRRLLDGQTDIESIKGMPWREFERLVAEAYRRKGYVAEVIGNDSGDGGVDIELTGRGERVLVQCKQWRAYTVGVRSVRELLGVVVSKKATKGVLVTSGRFTQEALRFGSENDRLELLDGSALAELIRGVQVGNSVQQGAAPIPTGTITEPSPRCPSCGLEMVLRTARNGPNAGSQFWGCRKFPTCRGTRPR